MHLNVQAKLLGQEESLWMEAENECGVLKLVFLATKPTLMPQPELSDLQSAARFVADFIAFEPPLDLDRPPLHLISPKTTLGWQVKTKFFHICSSLWTMEHGCNESPGVRGVQGSS